MYIQKKQGSIIILLLIFCVLLFTACEPKTSKGKGTYKPEPKQVSSYQIQYQDAMEELQQKKAEVEKHETLYNNSKENRRSILDDREIKIAKNAIVKYSNELLSLSERCLNNHKVISNVSSSGETYLGYKNYAEKMLRKYE